MSEWSGVPTNEHLPLFLNGTGWRVCSMRSTFRRAWNIRHRIGVTRLADLTELDRVGLPVASAVRPLVNSVQITAAQGKGLTILQACVSALMEATERWAAAQTFQGEVSSIEDLRLTNRHFVSPDQLGGSLLTRGVVEWISARHLANGNTVLVPASDVFFPYFPPPNCVRPSRPSTSGLASGNVLTEAILHGLFEVVERSVTSFAWQKSSVHLVPNALLYGTPEGDLLRQLERTGAQVFVCELPNPFLPVYSVFTFDHGWLGPRIVIGGQGAHLSAQVALQRALLEAAQSRIVALQGSREDLVRHSVHWDKNEKDGRSDFEELNYLAARNGEGLPPVEYGPIPQPITIEDALKQTCSRLAEAGYSDILYIDLGKSLQGISVARVIVPGLIDEVVKQKSV